MNSASLFASTSALTVDALSSSDVKAVQTAAADRNNDDNDDQYDDDFDQNDENTHENTSAPTASVPVPAPASASASAAANSANKLPISSSASASSSSSAAHRYYRVSIDLRSLSLTAPSASAHSYSLSYRHSLLGEPVSAADCHVARDERTADIAQSFSLFEFITAREELRRVLRQQPMTVTLIQRPQQTAAANATNNNATATAAVNLSHLETAPLYNENVRVIDAHVGLYENAAHVNITPTPEQPLDLLVGREQPIATLHIVCTLQDLGDVTAEQQQQQQSRRQTQPLLQQSSPPAAISLSSSSAMEARATTEYQVAWELELWRRTEQSKHEKQWESVLQQRLNQLEAEYKHIAMQREQQFSIKLREVTSLEKKLQSALFDVGGQEKKLAVQREDLERRLAIMKADSARLAEEAQLTNTRLKESHSHALTLHKRSVTDLQSQIDLLRTKLTGEESRYRYLEETHNKYRQTVNKSTVGELRSLVSERDITIKALRSELENERALKIAAEASVLEWRTECERLRAEMDERERLIIAKEKREAETLRLEYNAKSRSLGMRRDVEELFDIRRKLKHLTDPTTATTHKTTIPHTHFAASTDAALTQSAFGSFRTSGNPLSHPLHATSSSAHNAAAPMTYYERFSLDHANDVATDENEEDVADTKSPTVSPNISPHTEHKEFAQSNSRVLDDMHVRPLTAIHVSSPTTPRSDMTKRDNTNDTPSDSHHQPPLQAHHLDHSPTRSETSTAASTVTAEMNESRTLPMSGRRPLKKTSAPAPAPTPPPTKPADTVATRRREAWLKASQTARTRPSPTNPTTRTSAAPSHLPSQSMTITHSPRALSPSETFFTSGSTSTPDHRRVQQSVRTTQSPHVSSVVSDLTIRPTLSSSLATVRSTDDIKHSVRTVYVDETKAKAPQDVTRTAHTRGGLHSSLTAKSTNK